MDRLNRTLGRARLDQDRARATELDLREREKEDTEDADTEPTSPRLSRDGLERKELLRTLLLVERGQFNVRISPCRVDVKVARSLNRVIALNEAMAAEFNRVDGPELRKRITFGFHPPVTEGTFQQGHGILARHRFEVFTEEQKTRTFRLLHQSTVSLGFLALGPRDALKSCPLRDCFQDVDRAVWLFQKVRD